MSINKWLAGALIGVIAASFTFDAEAQRRLGGGKSFGKQSAPVQQRQATPPAQAPAAQPNAPQQAPAAQPAARPGAAGAGAAAAARSPWRGALMGLAAGLGIAALASWLGFGEGLAMLLTVLLIGLGLALLVGFVLRRMRGNAAPQPAYGGAGAGNAGGNWPQHAEPARVEPQPLQRTSIEPAAAGARPGSAMDEFMRGGTPAVAAATGPWGIPADFDTAAFLDNAKRQYIALQGAWDTGNLDALEQFTAPDMFIALTHELRARGGAHSHTEVVTLDATLLGIEHSPAEYLASVKFDGTLKVDGELERVDEVWNLSKPASGRGGWVLAGIQQLA